MVLEYNGNTYRYEGQVDHRHNAKGLKNSGKLVLYVPTMRYVSDWDYSRTNDEIDAVVHSSDVSAILKDCLADILPSSLL
jgi:hypothetical protein